MKCVGYGIISTTYKGIDYLRKKLTLNNATYTTTNKRTKHLNKI